MKLGLRVLAGLAMLLAAIAIPASAQRPRLYPDTPPAPTNLKTPRAASATGVVQYDPGSPADAFLQAPTPMFDQFGNLFDTRSGSPLTVGTVTRVSWYQGAPGLGWFFIGAPSVGNATPFATIASPLTNAFNSFSTIQNPPVPFFLGMIGRNGPMGSNYVAVRSASYNSQGFHGRQKSFQAGTTALPSQNAMIRVSGDIVIPVELLEFEID